MNYQTQRKKINNRLLITASGSKGSSKNKPLTMLIDQGMKKAENFIFFLDFFANRQLREKSSLSELQRNRR